MTSPILPNVSPSFTFQQEGLGGEVHKGIAGIIQALMARQEMETTQQKLQMAQQDLDSQLASAEQGREVDRGTIKKQQRDLENQNKTLAAQQQAWQVLSPLALSGKYNDPEALAQARAGIKDPEAMLAFDGMIQQTLKTEEGLAQAATARETAATAKVAEPVRRSAIRAAERLLLNPNAKLSTNPTVAEAVGAEYLGIVGTMNTRIQQESSGASENRQAALARKQMALQIMGEATDAYNAALKENPDASITRQGFVDSVAQSYGLTGQDVQQSVRDTFRRFRSDQPLAPDPLSQFKTKSRIWRNLAPEQQGNLESAAEMIAKGEGTMPTSEELRQAGYNPSEILPLLSAMAQTLGASSEALRQK